MSASLLEKVGKTLAERFDAPAEDCAEAARIIVRLCAEAPNGELLRFLAEEEAAEAAVAAV